MASKLLTVNQMVEIFGQPGDVKNLVAFKSPYQMVVAWDSNGDGKINDTINQFSVHKLIATPLKRVFDALLCIYGIDQLNALRINWYGGCFNFRPKRGLEAKYASAIKAKNYSLANSYLSNHSWGTAIDLDPSRNLLKETHTTARFARAEYKAMIDAFYAHGFLSYGIERDNDWMHFEHGGKLF